MVYVRQDTCYDGCGCDPVQQMEEEDADKYLTDNAATYIGYLTIDSAPGFVLFARPGTKTFKVIGYQCHVYSPELPPVADEDESEDESEDEDESVFEDVADGFTPGGLFKTATLPAQHINMTGYKRPGRGQGLMDGEQITLFRGVDAADILQGGLGDCWLLSAFAALAEYPKAVLSLFQQRKASETGEYSITLFNFLSGCWQTIKVDDRLPVIQGGMGVCKCAYVQPTADGEIWTCLLEKAFATMFDNSYKTISGGVSTTAFAALCGVGGDKLAYLSLLDQGWVYYQPVLDSWRPYGDSNFQYGTWPDGKPGNQPKSTNELHQLLCLWDANNYIMCANTQGGSDTDTSDQGIVQGHAYTLIGAVSNVGAIQANLVQVRNPWGRKEWTGDWSDNSSLWDEHPDVKDILKPHASADGTFWISREDFAKNYPAIAVVMKDMGRNYEKVSNPKPLVEKTLVVYGAARNLGNEDVQRNLGIELPTKDEKIQVKQRKKHLMKARGVKDGICAEHGVCADCSVS